MEFYWNKLTERIFKLKKSIGYLYEQLRKERGAALFV